MHSRQTKAPVKLALNEGQNIYRGTRCKHWDYTPTVTTCQPLFFPEVTP